MPRIRDIAEWAVQVDETGNQNMVVERDVPGCGMTAKHLLRGSDRHDSASPDSDRVLFEHRVGGFDGNDPARADDQVDLVFHGEHLRSCMKRFDARGKRNDIEKGGQK